MLSSEYVILVNQSNNNFIFIQFLYVFDVFSSYQPFVDSQESSPIGVETSLSLNCQLYRSWMQLIIQFFIRDRKLNKWTQPQTYLFKTPYLHDGAIFYFFYFPTNKHKRRTEDNKSWSSEQNVLICLLRGFTVHFHSHCIKSKIITRKHSLSKSL